MNSEQLDTDCINEEARTLDEFIADYFNNLCPDVIAKLITRWKELKYPEETK